MCRRMRVIAGSMPKGGGLPEGLARSQPGGATGDVTDVPMVAVVIGVAAVIAGLAYALFTVHGGWDGFRKPTKKELKRSKMKGKTS